MSMSRKMNDLRIFIQHRTPLKTKSRKRMVNRIEHWTMVQNKDRFPGMIFDCLPDDSFHSGKIFFYGLRKNQERISVNHKVVIRCVRDIQKSLKLMVKRFSIRTADSIMIGIKDDLFRAFFLKNLMKESAVNTITIGGMFIGKITQMNDQIRLF